MKPLIAEHRWEAAKAILDAGFPVTEAEKYTGISVWSLRQKFPGRRTRGIRASIPDYYRAKEMLEVERTSYNEAERTTGIPARSLRRYFPGLGWEQRGSDGADYRRMTRMLEKATAHYA